MNDLVLLGLAFVFGFIHTFEADHLAAVTNLVTRSHSVSTRAKDGMYWGLGHSLMIWIVGILILVLKYTIQESAFTSMEGFVGVMLITLGVYRLVKSLKPHQHHIHSASTMALGVGLVHGLAGSGAVVAAAVTETSSVVVGMLYLLVFGLGSIVGMFFVSAILSWLLGKANFTLHKLVHVFTWLSSFFCIGYGVLVIKNSWFN